MISFDTPPEQRRFLYGDCRADIADSHHEIRQAVRELCVGFPPAYFRGVDCHQGNPEAFFAALRDAGWAGALVPKALGGKGLSVEQVCAAIDEICRHGAPVVGLISEICNTLMLARYGMAVGGEACIEAISNGRLRCQAIAVTEGRAAECVPGVATAAVRRGDQYIVNGCKSWASRAQHTDLLLMLVRTSSVGANAVEGEKVSLILVDLRDAVGRGLTIHPFSSMEGHDACEIALDHLVVPAGNLVGEEGQGYLYIHERRLVEMILTSASCIGSGHWFLERVSGRDTTPPFDPLDDWEQQCLPLPLSKAFRKLDAASAMSANAARLFDRQAPCEAEVRMASMLAAAAVWEMADTCQCFYGRSGFEVKLDIERKFREARQHQIVPMSTNVILAYIGEQVLGMPAST